MGEEAKRKKARWKLITTIVTFIALAVFVILAREKIVETIKNLGQVNAYALLLIIPLQMLNYHSYTKMYQSTLKIIGENISYKEMLKIALELNFVNNVFPTAGVSGFTYISARLKSHNVPTSKTTLVQVMRLIFIFVSYQFLMAAGLFMLALSGRANSLMILIASSLATLLFVFTFGVAFIAGSNKRINAFVSFAPRVLNKLAREVMPHRKQLINIDKIRLIFTDLHENYLVIKDNYNSLLKPLMYALLANITEVASIYAVYIAFGQLVNPGAVIIAYAIANFSGLISVLPGGVGIYEGLMTGTLVAAGIPAVVSLPVTVMYRVLTMLIQIPIGYYYYYKNLHKDKYLEAVA